MIKQLTALATFTFLAANLTGCATPTEDEEVAAIQSALELEDGGMDMTAEQAAFGEPAVLETPELTGDDIQDTTAMDPNAAGMERYRVLLLWGALPRAKDDSTAPVPTEVLDWSGTISVSSGAVRVSRTLKFDRHDGVLPRQDARTIQFVSRTLPHVDGLALEVVASPDATITFDTETLTASVTMDELVQEGRGATPVGNGSGFAFAGYQVDDSCNSGFLIGHWKNLRPNLGKFRGRVLDADGDTEGYLRGIYGDSQRFGENRFFGKYISEDGDARGLVAGGYGDGDIAGRWGTDAGGRGGMRGRYFHGLDRADGRGFWLGRWRESCE